jgi:hypothetical protein
MAWFLFHGIPPMNRKHLYALLGLALVTGLTFHRVLLPPVPLVAQDAPLAAAVTLKQVITSGKDVVWIANGYLGSSGYEVRYGPLTWLTLLTPTPLVNTVQFVLLAFLAGAAMYGVGLAMGVRPLAAFTGACAVLLSGHFITTAYSGHTGTFLMWPCFLAATALITIGIRRRAWLPCLWAGVLGGLGAGQLDIAVIIALFLAAWVVYEIIATRAQGQWAKLVVCLALALACGMAYSLPTVLDLLGLAGRAGGLGSVADDQKSAEDKWNWATQWSLPVNETLTLVAPGFYGLGLEPASPYWGRIGQDARWPTQRAGFPRFSMSTQGVGIVTVALALLAVLAAAWAPAQRGAIYFWACAALAALLFAWGRYCDVAPTSGAGLGPYRLFYWLPKMDSMRNPLKFLYPFMLALGILAACGMDILLTMLAPHKIAAKKREPNTPRRS